MRESMELKEYLKGRPDCACNRAHGTDLMELEIGSGAIQKLPGILKKYNYKKLLVVADVNTWEAAGSYTASVLEAAGFTVDTFVYQDTALVPEERAIGRLTVAVDPGFDAVVGVGSGTLNDLCKYISYKMGLDYFVVGSAPSMDGFSSNVAAMITNQLKTTYEVHTPKGVIGDVDVLRTAPMPMIAAGVGDILGKYVCLTDWKISHLLQGEYYCGYVEEMVLNSIRVIMENADLVREREPKAVEAVMNGLTLSGIAISYVGNSRPASGSEHHLSHYWEMMFLFQNRPAVLHGTKVGIGTISALKLYEMLADRPIDFDKARAKARSFDLENWKEKIRKAYGPAAGEVIRLEERVHKNDPQVVLSRIGQMEANWDEVLKLIRALPKAEEISAVLKGIGAPVTPAEIGVDASMVKNSVLYAKELRNRFGLLQILFDLGLNEEFADRLTAEFGM